MIIDTASGINLTHGRLLLLDYKEFPKPLSSYYGVGSTDNQKPILIVGQGYLPIRVTKKKVIGIPTLFCPDEDITIISALQLLRLLDVKITPDYGCLQFKDRKVATIHRGNILHVRLKDIIADKQPTSKQNYKIRRIKENYSPDTMSLYEAHLRLNHISAQAIKDSISANVFDDIHQLILPKEQKKFWCEICRSAKAKQNFHYTNSMNAYTEIVQPGTSWSIDLFGPVQDLPVDSDRYMLLMVDSVSRYIVVTTHKSKSEEVIAPQIRKNVRFIERQFGRRIREILTDQGSEFKNKTLRTFCEEEGIQLIHTTTEDHAANGRAERNIGTIVADTRTLLLQSQLGLKYWSYAAKSAAYTRNMIYNKNAGGSPLRILSADKVKILLQNFIPFGADAIVWQHADSKLEPRGVRGTILCRDPNGYGYLVKLHKKNKIISTRHFQISNLLFDPTTVNDKIGVKEVDFDPDTIRRSLRTFDSEAHIGLQGDNYVRSKIVKENEDHSNVTTVDPNIIDVADISPLVKNPVHKSHKRTRSEDNSEVYDIPRNLREDIVGKDNVISIKDGEDINKRLRSRKKHRVRRIQPQLHDVQLVLPPEDWEHHAKVHAIYFKDAIINNPDKAEKALFQAAFDKEFNNLVEKEVFDPEVKYKRSAIPSNKIIPTNTIFTVKRSGEHKARIVARGDKQDRTTYGDISTTTLGFAPLKLLLMHANNNRWHLKSVDINCAFLHASLDEDLYIPHPADHSYVTPLKKSLYGLKQSPKLWTDLFRQTMHGFGYKDERFSPGLYVAEDGQSMIGTYVDDCIIAASNPEQLEHITNLIASKFSVKTVATMQDDIFQADVLGIDLRYDRKRGMVSLSLETYITNMINTYYKDLIEKNKKKLELPHSTVYDITPHVDTLQLSKKDLKRGIKMLQEKIGRLNCIRTHGRPDIEFAVAKIARYAKGPPQETYTKMPFLLAQVNKQEYQNMLNSIDYQLVHSTAPSHIHDIALTEESDTFPADNDWLIMGEIPPPEPVLPNAGERPRTHVGDATMGHQEVLGPAPTSLVKPAENAVRASSSGESTGDNIGLPMSQPQRGDRCRPMGGVDVTIPPASESHSHQNLSRGV